jgi:hypothetical protein
LTVASVGLGVGVVAFRNSIDAAAGGIGFGQLTAEQVRYFEGYPAALHPGIGTALYTLAPLVAAGGVILGCHRRFGYLFTAYAIVLAAQNPGRTLAFDTVLSALLCWIYYKQFRTATRSGVRHAWRTVVVVVVTLVCLGSYFQHEAHLLNKSLPGQILPGTKVPAALISITIYLTGSPEALSTALDENVNPTEGEHGRTVWIVPRILGLFDRGVTAPNTVAQAVPIPYEYNVYTWAGDLWFDFGWLGVVLAGLLLGFVTIVVDDRARRRRSGLWSWLGAAWGVTLLSGIICFEVFWMSLALWVVAGLLVFGRPRFPRRPAIATTQLPLSAAG